MQSPHEMVPLGLPPAGAGHYACHDNHYRSKVHGPKQRYISPTSGQCKELIVQAVHPRYGGIGWTEVPLGENPHRVKRLAIWLVTHLPKSPEEVLHWFMRWVWFTLALIWPFFDLPKYTGLYRAYLSRYRGHLWAARSPREYSLRNPGQDAHPPSRITHGTHPRQLFIRGLHPNATSWSICSDPNLIKQQSYVAISYQYGGVVPADADGEERHVDEEKKLRLENIFTAQVLAVMESLKVSAFWIDLKLAESLDRGSEEVNQDLYRMADVYRGAEFTLIMLNPPAGTTEEQAWITYGERLWTFPEVLLSRELRYKFRDGKITPITLHQLANRAYTHFPEESAIINSYGLRDPLERLERLSLLKSALWRRESGRLQRIKKGTENPLFRADRVYALMGFFEHRILPDPHETDLQALVRLSMANDNDRFVERMVCLLPSQTKLDTPCWYAEDDQWGSNLWDIEPDGMQVVGLTSNNALVLGGCRAAAIRWKDFPSVAFATRRSIKRLIATFLPNLFWYIFFIGVILTASTSAFRPSPPGIALLAIGLALMFLAPLSVAYGASGRIMQAQPWLVGVKGLISAEEASDYMYGGSISNKFDRTHYSASGTPLSITSRVENDVFRRGNPIQLETLKGKEDEKMYTLIDTVSATIYYFYAERPPTVCLYTGRESGLGRFLLCSETCTANELHKETVIRMPWYVSQSMPPCDWVALR